MKSILGLSLLVSLSSVFGQEIPPGITKKEYQAPVTGNQVWVYYPRNVKATVPCVLIAPAGTRMFHGIELGEGDIVEHLPYVEAGFAVVAYGLSGPWPEEETDAAVENSIKAFMQSEGGLKDAAAALQTAKAKHPFIDTSRVYAVGHSSAADVALSLVQRSTAFRGCVAYAPEGNIEDRFEADGIAGMDSEIPGFKTFIYGISPWHNVGKIQCPVFVFNAKDDDNVLADSVTAYVERLKQAGKAVEHIEVPAGGHYDSMLNEGIPLAIKWLTAQETAAQ